MIDPSDPSAQPIDLGARPVPAPKREEAAPGVPSIAKERTETRLAEEFDLVRVHAPVYVLDKKAAAARSAGAERVAKHRAKLATEGLRPAAVPATVLDQVKAAGGWTDWQQQIKTVAETAAIEKAMVAAPPPEITAEVRKAGGWPQWLARKTAAAAPQPTVAPQIVERKVEVRVEVPAKLGTLDTESLNLGRKVQAIKGWKATVLRWLL